jgi:hypothetical protein
MEFSKVVDGDPPTKLIPRMNVVNGHLATFRDVRCSYAFRPKATLRRIYRYAAFTYP